SAPAAGRARMRQPFFPDTGRAGQGRGPDRDGRGGGPAQRRLLSEDRVEPVLKRGRLAPATNRFVRRTFTGSPRRCAENILHASPTPKPGDLRYHGKIPLSRRRIGLFSGRAG